MMGDHPCSWYHVAYLTCVVAQKGKGIMMTKLLVRADGIFHTEGGSIALWSFKTRSQQKKPIPRRGARVRVTMISGPDQSRMGPSVRARLKVAIDPIMRKAPTTSTRFHAKGCRESCCFFEDRLKSRVLISLQKMSAKI